MKIITQETFDQVVLENLNDFNYALEEAIDETIQEFECQSVQLSNIVKNLHVSQDKSTVIHEVVEALNKMKCNECSSEEYNSALKSFTAQCNISLAHRVLANKYDAYNILIAALKLSQSEQQGKKGDTGVILKAITALTDTNSDILDSEGISIMINLLSNCKESFVMEYLCRWCIQCCLKHERNRQKLFEAAVPGKLVDLLKANQTNHRIIIATSKALRAFTLDDDIRLAYGNSHDHARMLVEKHNLIKISLSMINNFPENSDVTSELLSTVSRLCVRAEYCQDAVDNGALSVINNILVSFPNNDKLNKQAINLLKTLCGNDRVKDETMKIGAPKLVICSLLTHQLSVPLGEAALGAISMLALRSSQNAKELINFGAADAVVQAMKIHPMEKQLQKIGCMAIRNLASGVPENKIALVDCQVETVIHSAMHNFQDEIKDMAKAALRDLDLDVHLVEQWKGTGRNLEQD